MRASICCCCYCGGWAGRERQDGCERAPVRVWTLDYLVYTCSCSLQRLNSVAVFQTQSAILA